MNQEQVKRWIFHNCSRYHNWVVFQNLDDILRNTEYINQTDQDLLKITSRSEIVYIHTANLTPNSMTSILETKNGFYLIDNRKIPATEKETNENNEQSDDEPEQSTEQPTEQSTTEQPTEQPTTEQPTTEPAKEVNPKTEALETPAQEMVILSKVHFYGNDLIKLIKTLPKRIRLVLSIKKITQMKLTVEQQNASWMQYDQVPLDQLVKSKDNYNSRNLTLGGHLDLTDVTRIQSKDLLEWKPSVVINEITLQSCYQFRSFEWLQALWVQNVSKVTLVNMTHFTNDSLHFMVHQMPKIKELYVFSCPQINIKVIPLVLSKDKLETLCLNDPNLICQPTEYSGLITEAEWLKFRNRSLKKLLINSSNISVDIIDYLRKSLLNLETLIIHPKKYQYFKDCLINGGVSSDPNMRKIRIANTDNKAIEVSADFVVKNLLKHRYNDPFSKSMLKVMDRIRQKEDEEAPTSCPIVEM